MSVVFLISFFNSCIGGNAVTSNHTENYPTDLDVITTTNANKVVQLAVLEARSVTDIAFNPNGSIIATSNYGSIRLWDAKTYTLLNTLDENVGLVDSLEFSPDGELLASGDIVGTVRLWNPATGQEISVLTEGYTGTVAAIAFSPNGHLLAIGGGNISSSPVVDYSVWVWDLEANTRKFVLKEDDDWVVSLAFSPDGQLLASGSVDGCIHLWDVETGKKLKTLRDGVSEVYSIAFSPDGSLLASSSWLGGIRLWDVKSGNLIKHWIGHGKPQPPGTGVGIRVKGITFNRDGSLLATVGEDGVIKLWDAKTGEELWALQEDRPVWLTSVVFSPDGRLLVTGGTEGAKTQIWGIR